MSLLILGNGFTKMILKKKQIWKSVYFLHFHKNGYIANGYISEINKKHGYIEMGIF